MSSSLRQRAEKALGWNEGDSGSFSLPTLCALVRPVNEELAKEMAEYIALEKHVLIPHRPRRR